MASASQATNQLCIISRDPLRAFIAGLNPALRDCEELTIIVDRRQAGSDNVAAPPAVERRRHPSVDAKVKRDGFALVPLSTTENPKHPAWIERILEHQSAGDDVDADASELQRIREFKRRLKPRIGRLVRVSAIAGAFSVLIVLFVQTPAGRALVNRARLVASTTSERTPDASIESHPVSVVEIPALPRPARLPAKRSGTSRDPGRAPSERVSRPPNANPSAPTLWSEATPPAPPSPPIAASSEPTDRPATAPEAIRPTRSNSRSPRGWPSRPSAGALDPTRPSESSPRRTAHVVSTPGEVTASPSRVPRQPSAAGLEDWMQALAERVTRDVDTAGAEAKRQIDELTSNTIRSLDEMRRVWHTATRAFSDTAADQAQRETAAREKSAGEP